jgi:ferredoxin-NADP reductase
MVVQLGCSCRISIFGKVPNGSEDSALWKRISVASGSHLATTIMATPGKSSDMTVIEAAAPPVRRLEWQRAQVREIVAETYRVKSLLLHVANRHGHLPGQHVDIRLTAADGYQAQRSYSIASPPEDELLTLTVERVDDGEVSPYLVGELRAGDQFELRGPIGGYFVWTAAIGGPLCLIAGGSGIVPLMAMLRHRERRKIRTPTLLLYSSRSLEDVIYRAELDALARRDPHLCVVNTLTRKQPAGWMGRRGRIDKAVLAETCFPPQQNPKIFVCGSTPFVEDVSRLLVELGHDPLTIKTERFGPSGGQAS